MCSIHQLYNADVWHHSMEEEWGMKKDEGDNAQNVSVHILAAQVTHIRSPAAKKLHLYSN